MLKSSKFMRSLGVRFKSNSGEKMAKSKNHTAIDPWDQRALGADAQFVGVADVSHEVSLTQALEMQAKQPRRQSAIPRADAKKAA